MALMTRNTIGVATLIVGVAVCVALGTLSLVDLWQNPEPTPLVKWSVLVFGSILAMAIIGGYLLASVGRGDIGGLQVRLRIAILAALAMVFIFVTPIFSAVADTLGTLAGLLIGILAALVSMATGYWG